MNARELIDSWKTAIVFPVDIFHKDGKWHKIPLIKGWQNLTKSVEFDSPIWDQANGIGILIKGGIVMADVDGYKPDCAAAEWLKKMGVTGDTRVHGTISGNGGIHAFYRVPASWGELRTRANLVPGLDIRGGADKSAGFAAFGEGYTVIKNRPLAMLSDAACAAIQGDANESTGNRAGTYISDSALKGYQPPANADSVTQKLAEMAKIIPKLDARLKGSGVGLNDRSRSGMDYSLAHTLAFTGFSYDETMFVLLEVFQHGAARWTNGMVAGVSASVRQAARCVTKAMTHKQIHPTVWARFLENQEASEPPDIADAMAEIIKKQTADTGSLSQRAMQRMRGAT